MPRVNTEAEHLMLRHAFEVLGCLRIEFKTDSLNMPSRRALLRIGARQEGTFRNLKQRAWTKAYSDHLDKAEEDNGEGGRRGLWSGPGPGARNARPRAGQFPVLQADANAEAIVGCRKRVPRRRPSQAASSEARGLRPLFPGDEKCDGARPG